MNFIYSNTYLGMLCAENFSKFCQKNSLLVSKLVDFNITTSKLPSDLFDKINQYWGTNVRYNIRQDEKAIKTTLLNKYIKPEGFKVENNVLSFIFECYAIPHTIALDDLEYNKYRMDLNIQASDYKGTLDEYYEQASKLFQFKENLVNRLYMIRRLYRSIYGNIGYLRTHKIDKFKDLRPQLPTKFEFDKKCIICNDVVLLVERRLMLIDSFYCPECIKTKTKLTAKDHAIKYIEYLVMNANRFKTEFDHIVGFLREPFPEEFSPADGIVVKLHK